MGEKGTIHPPPRVFLRKDVISNGLHPHLVQGCDCKGFVVLGGLRDFGLDIRVVEIDGDLTRPRSEVGRKRAHPLGFWRSVQVVVNQWVGDRRKTSVRRRLKGKESGERLVRRGRVSSRRRVARRGVHVNNDLSCGNSNEEFECALRDIRHQTECVRITRKPWQLRTAPDLRHLSGNATCRDLARS